MQTLKLDLAIIGAGSAGLAAYATARHFTQDLVLIEGGPHGTTCARVGCMPSKLLIAPAELVHSIERAEGFGLRSEGISVDGKAVMERVRSERDRFVNATLESVQAIPADRRLKGMAKFIAPGKLQVGEDWLIEAKAYILATGSSPVIPPPYQPLGDLLMTNEELFELEDLPRSVAVVGPGVIGLELGQALSRLGVEVAIYGLGGLFGPFADPEMRQAALETFSKELEIHADAQELKAQERDGQVEVSHQVDGQIETRLFERLLITTGRKPNLAALDLAAAGLKLDPRGMPALDPTTLKCDQAPIFIAGDANGLRPLLHEAIEQGKQAAKNAFNGDAAGESWQRTPLAVVFTEPQIAVVGQGYKDLEEGCYATGEVDWAQQGRAQVILKNLGRLRLYGDVNTGRLLGAEMFGPEAEHLAHLLAWSIESQATVEELLNRPFYHPVLEEGLRTALRDLRKNLKRAPQNDDCSCCPGE